MDLDKLRDEDRLYVAEVVKYVTGHGLRVELGGGADRGDKNYKDIDLLARGAREDVVGVFQGLTGVPGAADPFPQRAQNGLEYTVQREGSKIKYMGTVVDERLRIMIGDTNIDLSLEVDLSLEAFK